MECLANSECIAAGRTVKDCMQNDKTCESVRVRFAMCKRGQLDMRKRIKGNNFGDDAPEKDEQDKKVTMMLSLPPISFNHPLQ